ncbi:MAG: HAD-IIB family hydrolase [Mycoplasma sp.]
MIKWIVSDLEGTLLDEDMIKGINIDANTLSIWNEKVNSQKYIFTIATGRHYLNALKIIEDLKIELPKNSFIVGMNGLQIFSISEQKLILDKTLHNDELDSFATITEYLSKHYLGQYTLFGYKKGDEQLFLFDSKADKSQAYIQAIIDHQHKTYPFKYSIIDNFNQIQNAYLSIVFFHGEWNYEQIKKDLSPLVSNFDFLKGHKTLLEIVPSDAGKLSAIKTLAEILSIKPEETLAIGDSYNDIEMLKYAGKSVTRKTASINVQNVCNNIIDAPSSVFVGIALKEIL